jgi:hypothetical protein
VSHRIAQRLDQESHPSVLNHAGVLNNDGLCWQYLEYGLDVVSISAWLLAMGDKRNCSFQRKAKRGNTERKAKVYLEKRSLI